MMRGLLCLVFSVWCVLAGAQEPADELTSVLSYMKHAMMMNHATPQEKVYLHFDNTGYFKGETMRYKAYVVRSDNSRLSDISRVLYVELVNPSGDVVDTHKLKVVNGMAEGDFPLDSVFGNGFFEVRAYTRYMMNWGGAGVFSRVFPVFKHPAQDGDYSHPQIDEFSFLHRLPNGRKEGDGKYGKQRDRGLSVTFYPEGGHLVNGLPSRVAFSVVDSDGRHAEVMGLVVNADGETVATARSGKDGRGLFDIVPDGRAMQFVVTDSDGRRHQYDLPQSEEEGCVMRLDAVEGNDIVATIDASQGMQGRLLGYTLMNSGNVVSADTLMVEGRRALSFDRSMMPAGVNQLTFFNSEGRIMAERLFFICPQSQESDTIRTRSVGSELKPCGRVSLEVTATPNSFLSLSAMDAGTMVNGRVGNARTWMLLSSEVRGYIENVDYYFESDDTEHRQNADMLMMVQGWRRYDWRVQSGAESFDCIEGHDRMQPIEDKLYLFGRLKPDTFKWRKKHPVAGVELDAFLFRNTGEHLAGHTVTDSLGNYAFEMPEVEGEWNLQIRTRWNDKNAAYVVGVDRHFSPVPRLLSPYETDMIALPEAVSRMRLAALSDASDDGQPKMGGSGKASGFVLPTVKVKGHYFTDFSRLSWYDEKTGARKSSIYYDVDNATDAIADRGEPLPTLYEWLKQKNEFFDGTNTLDDRYVTINDSDVENEGKLISDMDGSITADMFLNNVYSVYKDGLTYKNRPVLWIVNNAYCTITYYPLQRFIVDEMNTNSAQAMPDFIDEVKSVYVSEDDDNYVKFIRSRDLERIHPVTVYVYTHPQFFIKEKGIRRTHFQGFNVPSEFEMEDYGIMPPMEDFRRTLYWAPNVRTDGDGKARVNFFNNSSCTQMYISAEGVGPDGSFIVSE